MKRIWELFPNLFAAVRKSHEEAGLVGAHDFVHAARVGEIAWQIAKFEWPEAEDSPTLAGAAGLCHNADRILQKELGVGRREVPKEEIELLVEDWLDRESFFVGQQYKSRQFSVMDAVLKHSGKNSLDDSHVLIALMDADRVVNLDIDHFARCGQHYHDIPVVDYKNWISDPEANYNNPKSVLYDIACSLEWVDQKTAVCVRTRLGKKLAGERAVVYKTFFDVLELQLGQEGIRPYPFS